MHKLLSKLFPQKLKNFFHLVNSYFFHLYYGKPSHKLKIIGVTGTDGKTTTSTMIYEIFKAAGLKVGLVSTISAKIGENEYPVGFHVTTPNPRLMQKFLKDMVDQGLEYAVLETTSHGLDQHRVGGIKYAAAVYTNVTHEHLDYHKSYDNYLYTKAKLMDQTDKDGFVVINMDDNSYSKLHNYAKDNGFKILTYGEDPRADVKSTEIELSENGSHFIVPFSENHKLEINLRVPGRYNIANSLAAIATAMNFNIPDDAIKEALDNLSYIEGRWMEIQEKPFKVVVDFAHTPNALKKVLQYANENMKGDGRIILVFGCAGLRDAEKRPMMGAIAGELADVVVLTAEDPRTESIAEINNQIAEGIKQSSNKIFDKDYFSIHDRKEAIRNAIDMARDGDLVLITGKGHEKSMNLDGISEIHWSDEEVVREILSSQSAK